MLFFHHNVFGEGRILSPSDKLRVPFFTRFLSGLAVENHQLLLDGLRLLCLMFRRRANISALGERFCQVLALVLAVPNHELGISYKNRIACYLSVHNPLSRIQGRVHQLGYVASGTFLFFGSMHGLACLSA